MSTEAFRPIHIAQHLQEMDDLQMAAPNSQPAGKRPGPKAAHTHAPQQSGQPAKSITADQPSGQGVAGHGTPAKGPKNQNRLH